MTPCANGAGRSSMPALHRSGSSSRRLGHLPTPPRLLCDELGIDPLPRSARPRGSDPREDPTLDLPRPAPPRSLPTPRTSFRRARNGWCVTWRKHLHADRLITLVGPGGVGKSRLAVEAADKDADCWPDGAWWVDLAHVEEAGSLGSHLVRALGVTVAPGLSSMQALRWFLAPRGLLLVADNAEGFTGGSEPELTELLEAAADLTALVTSRIPLEVRVSSRSPCRPSMCRRPTVTTLSAPKPCGSSSIAWLTTTPRSPERTTWRPSASCAVGRRPATRHPASGPARRRSSPGPVLAELDDVSDCSASNSRAEVPRRQPRGRAGLDGRPARCRNRAGLARLSVFLSTSTWKRRRWSPAPRRPPASTVWWRAGCSSRLVPPRTSTATGSSTPPERRGDPPRRR